MQMLFELVEGHLLARLPQVDGETPRVADGVQFFTVPQAATHLGKSPEVMRMLWLSTWEDVLAPQQIEAVRASEGMK